MKFFGVEVVEVHDIKVPMLVARTDDGGLLVSMGGREPVAIPPESVREIVDEAWRSVGLSPP